MQRHHPSVARRPHGPQCGLDAHAVVGALEPTGHLRRDAVDFVQVAGRRLRDLRALALQLVDLHTPGRDLCIFVVDLLSQPLHLLTVTLPLVDERRDDVADELLALARPLIQTRFGMGEVVDRLHDVLPRAGGATIMTGWWCHTSMPRWPKNRMSARRKSGAASGSRDGRPWSPSPRSTASLAASLPPSARYATPP